MKRDRPQSCGVEIGSLLEAAQVSAPPSPDNLRASTVGPGIETLGNENEINVVFFADQNYPGMFDFLANSFSLANDAFSNSSVNAVYYNVGVWITQYGGPTVPTNLSKIHDYLDWMNGVGRAVIEAHRNDADMVVLLIPSPAPQTPGTCGIANLRYQNAGSEYVLGGSTSEPWLPDQPAYSVQVIGCGLNDITFAHELGHNFGLLHDGSGSLPLTPIEPDPRGYLFPTSIGTRATVMGCVAASSCDRLGYYSDPGYSTSQMGPTGSAGDPYYADAAEALRKRVGEYSRLR